MGYQILRWFVNLLTGVTITLFAVVWMLPRIGIVPYRILSGSMEPTYQVGEVVLVDTSVKNPGIGNAVAYHMGNSIIIHRVVRVNRDGAYVTKGDANASEDLSPVTGDEVLGRAVLGLGECSVLWEMAVSESRFLIIIGVVILNLIVEMTHKNVMKQVDKADAGGEAV